MRQNTRRVLALGAAILSGAFLAASLPVFAQDEPLLVPRPADFKLLLPLLPEPPQGWKADPAEGSTDNLGETEITTVHRDYLQGDATATTSISILDSVANPGYVEATTAAWNTDTTDAEGYTKSINLEDMPGFETFENEGKHGSLWLVVGKRYILQIEITGQEPAELQTWLKRIDLKKLAEVK